MLISFAYLVIFSPLRINKCTRVLCNSFCGLRRKEGPSRCADSTFFFKTSSKPPFKCDIIDDVAYHSKMVARMKICCVTVIVSISKLVSSFCLVFLSEGSWTLNLRF